MGGERVSRKNPVFYWTAFLCSWWKNICWEEWWWIENKKVGFLSSQNIEIWCFGWALYLWQWTRWERTKPFYPCLPLWCLTYVTKTDNKSGWRTLRWLGSAPQMHFWSLVLACVYPDLKPHKWWVHSDDWSLGWVHFFLMSSSFAQRKSFAPAGWSVVISILKVPFFFFFLI